MAKVTSVRLDDQLIQKLDELAAAVDRPRAWVIEQAITRYVEQEAWQVAAIRDALDEYHEGKSRLTPHEEVMRGIDQRLRRAGLERPLG